MTQTRHPIKRFILGGLTVGLFSSMFVGIAHCWMFAGTTHVAADCYATGAFFCVLGPEINGG